MTPKIKRFLEDREPASPCLVVDLDVVDRCYRRLQEALPMSTISYAVKANPAREILEKLVAQGSHFDAASLYEIEMCLAIGAPRSSIVYGNTIKKESDIAGAHARGVRLFAFDSEAELKKLADTAPGSEVYCRILTSGAGADWPLSRKFGCELDMAANLLVKAHHLGLKPAGVSFHVGSQQTDPSQWEAAIARTAQVFAALKEADIELDLVNLGGGFPVRYRKDVPGVDAIAERILAAMGKHFGAKLPRMIIEPGRYVTAEAGIIEAEVVLISNKDYANGVRWVYLDIGKFGGLAETMDEAIQYPIATPHDGGETGPVKIAGPTCDGADILYETAGYELPLKLAVGDKVHLLNAGAYTTTYSSVGFNGFPPLESYYI